jgi:hypothetical protein
MYNDLLRKFLANILKNYSVIALHGLNESSLNTGNAFADNIWLRHFLPKEISTARIISYRYDSNCVFKGLSEGALGKAARTFLVRLKRLRDSEKVTVHLTSLRSKAC